MIDMNFCNSGKVIGRVYKDLGFPVRATTRYYDDGKILTLIRTIDEAEAVEGWVSKSSMNYEEYTEDFISKRAFGAFRKDCKSLGKSYRCVCVS